MLPGQARQLVADLVDSQRPSAALFNRFQHMSKVVEVLEQPVRPDALVKHVHHIRDRQIKGTPVTMVWIGD